MKITDEILVEYILGQLSPEENEIVEDWYRQSKENIKQLDHLYFLLRVKEKVDIMKSADPDMAYYQFRDLLIKKNKNGIWKRNIYLLQRIAAILFCPLLILTTYLSLKDTTTSVQYVNIAANPGMVSTVQLPDGSKVWLNGGSHLKYPTQFDKKNRKVELKGEGYFDIITQPDKPFIVNAGNNYAVQVYGTEFNLSAYEEDNDIKTTLISGSVRLLINDTEQIILPNEKTTYNKSTGKLHVESVNTLYETCWKNGWIYFKDHPMKDVLKTMERFYNVDFIVKDNEVMHSMINGKFENEQITQVLEYLHVASGIKYEIKKPVIKDGQVIEKSIVYLFKE